MYTKSTELLKEGTRIGRWTTLGIHEPYFRGNLLSKLIHVRCDCGTEKKVDVYSLKYAYSKSCGCLRKEIVSTHGMAPSHGQTRFYSIWRGIITRCTKPNHNTFKYYGVKGIKVCDRWQKFEDFMEDMYGSYLAHVEQYGEKETSIDRIDVRGDYVPENCRWATLKEQAVNKTSIGRPKKLKF